MAPLCPTSMTVQVAPAPTMNEIATTAAVIGLAGSVGRRRSKNGIAVMAAAVSVRAIAHGNTLLALFGVFLDELCLVDLLLELLTGTLGQAHGESRHKRQAERHRHVVTTGARYHGAHEGRDRGERQEHDRGVDDEGVGGQSEQLIGLHGDSSGRAVRR